MKRPVTCVVSGLSVESIGGGRSVSGAVSPEWKVGRGRIGRIESAAGRLEFASSRMVIESVAVFAGWLLSLTRRCRVTILGRSVGGSRGCTIP